MCLRYDAKKGRFFRLCSRTRHRGTHLFVPWDFEPQGSHLTSSEIGRFLGLPPIPLTPGVESLRTVYGSFVKDGYWFNYVRLKHLWNGKEWIQIDSPEDFGYRVEDGRKQR